MEAKITSIFGQTLLVLGFLVIAANAIDYLAGWSSLPNWFFIIGLLFVSYGLYLDRTNKNFRSQ